MVLSIDEDLYSATGTVLCSQNQMLIWQKKACIYRCTPSI
jgi:hypothetical protein